MTRAPADPSVGSAPGPAAGYYVRWQGQVSGPYDLETLAAEWRAGRLSRLHQISSDRRGWQALGSHPELQAIVSPLPPIAAPEPLPEPEPVGTAPAAYVPPPDTDAPPATLRTRPWNPAPPVPATADILPPPLPRTAAALSVVLPGDLDSLIPAPWGRRLGAALLDLLVLILVGLCGVLLLQAVGLPLGAQSAAQRLLCGLLLAYCGWLYSAVLESCAWQATLGKLAVGLRVEATGGAPVGFGVAALRAFMKFWSVLPALAGLLAAFGNPLRQSWHDSVAGTRVVGGRL